MKSVGQEKETDFSCNVHNTDMYKVILLIYVECIKPQIPPSCTLL